MLLLLEAVHVAVCLVLAFLTTEILLVVLYWLLVILGVAMLVTEHQAQITSSFCPLLKRPPWPDVTAVDSISYDLIIQTEVVASPM